VQMRRTTERRLQPGMTEPLAKCIQSCAGQIQGVDTMNMIEAYQTRYSAVAGRRNSDYAIPVAMPKRSRTYATAAERMLAAIGEPEVFDTRNDPRLSRHLRNRVIDAIPLSKNSTAWKMRSRRWSRLSSMPPKGWKSANKYSICWDRVGGQVLDRRGA